MSDLLTHSTDLLIDIEQKWPAGILHDNVMLINQEFAAALLNNAVLAVLVQFYDRIMVKIL